MLILYGILFLFSLYVLFIIFLRVRHPYWSKQPVYHRHKLRYRFYQPGMLKNEPAEKDRYVDLKNIQFHTFEQSETIDRLSVFLNSHYKNSPGLVFNPSSKDISDYNNAVKENAHISFLQHTHLSCENTGKTVLESEIDIGTITTRPVNITITNSHLNVQLVDLLCVHPLYRTRYQVPKLIQTHKYQLEKKRGSAQIYLFKNEDHHSFGIIPFCQCTNYVFDMFSWKTPTKLGQEKILELSDCSSDILTDTVMSSKFKNKIYFDPFTMRQLIKNGNIHVYCLKVPNKVLGVYIFKRSCARYKGESIFECISSIKYCNTDLFLCGFHHASYLCCVKNRYKFLVIEGVSNNNIIIKKILSSKPCMNKYTVSYYFYNYITKSIRPEDVLLVI